MIDLEMIYPGASLRDLQTYQQEICKVRGWDKAAPTETFLLFSEEVGELAKALRNKLNLFTEKGKNQTDEALELEFADVFSYLMELANHFDIDLESSFVKKMKINAQRDWNN